MISSSIRNLILKLKERLKTLYIDPMTCDQHAWWILQAATGKSKAQLLTHPDQEIATEQLERIETILRSHLDEHKPLAYSIGTVPFLDLTIMVEPPILIPRMETEAWVAELIAKLKETSIEPHAILDLCTGSGCIGLALAHAFPAAHITAIDINKAAIALAQKNAAALNIKNITILHSDLFQALRNHQFDLIATNPPYITESEYAHLEPSVRLWEDAGALSAPDNGLALIKRIITQAPDYLRVHAEKSPNLIIEIGHTQGAEVAQLMQQAGYHDVEIHNDIMGNDRTVSGRYNG
jgi:release factor glutamine methyltransferase